MVLALCREDTNPNDLIFLDVVTKSKALISSRVRGHLVDCDVVDIGLPSEAEAIQMVMAAAGLPPTASIPKGAMEVAKDICKCLPLTLGMAGRLVQYMDVAENDWSDIVELMSEQGTDNEASVNTVISTSLKAFHGPEAEMMQTLLAAFGLAADDVKIPLEALQWMIEALSQQAPPTMPQLRLLIRRLIDRAL